MIHRRVIDLVGVRLASLADDGSIIWPTWPLTRVSRNSTQRPPFPFVYAVRAIDTNTAYFAWGPLAALLRVCACWDGHRYVIEEKLIRLGVLTGPEGGFFHEFTLAPIKRWFRGDGGLPCR